MVADLRNILANKNCLKECFYMCRPANNTNVNNIHHIAFTGDTDRSIVIYSVALAMIWQATGYYMVMYMSSMSAVPGSLYEAADIDGAGQWRQLWSITIPCVWNQIKVLVTSIIFNTLGNYVLIMTMANGGVDGSGMVMGLYVYQYGIDSTSPKVGYANAAAVLLLIISATTTMLVNGLMSRKEQD
jgi:N-acetylglucosamine transport system permease protein